jgi:RimJ/RimL family protein N-acetyltransferase
MASFPPRDRDAFMAHWHKLLRDDSVVVRTVLTGGSVAGNVMSFLRGETREVGYWLGREHWGRGIATVALRRFLRLEETRPLYAGVARQNIASRRVLEKCGFALVREEDEECTFELG